MDFSENYETKYHTEIQSMHFGAAKSHLSLHTLVAYSQDAAEEGKVKPRSYCTVSENTDHGAHAVWAHLTPIFNHLKEQDNGFDTIYFQSDGPASQYKNRYNLYFFTNVNQFLPGIKFASWNYSISGHGKGAADGVGGLVKRIADGKVKMGTDITDVKSFVETVESGTTAVKLYEISSKDIEQMKKRIPNDVDKITGINNLHQVNWSAKYPTRLFLRQLSCFECPLDDVCIHYSPAKKPYVNLKSNNCIL